MVLPQGLPHRYTAVLGDEFEEVISQPCQKVGQRRIVGGHACASLPALCHSSRSECAALAVDQQPLLAGMVEAIEREEQVEKDRLDGCSEVLDREEIIALLCPTQELERKRQQG